MCEKQAVQVGGWHRHDVPDVHALRRQGHTIGHTTGHTYRRISVWHADDCQSCSGPCSEVDGAELTLKSVVKCEISSLRG